ncbi:MAG: endonuclease/exonuclease/phosphatase family protein, partial [Actinomycetota bacterium]
MRVATFNIHHGVGADGRCDLTRIARVIGALEADVVALQELDVGWERSGRVDQPAALAEMLGFEVSFHPTFVRPD